MKRFFAAAILSAAAVTVGAQQPAVPIEWPYVGGDQAHTKYSTADEITAANVDQLEIAWEWEPNEMPMPELGARPSSFQATPIMIGNVLYVSTAYNRVAAIDAETGAELWAFDSKAYEREARHGFIHRGIAYWRDGDDFRIFLNSRDRLYAIDAATGREVASFGENGSVSLIAGHGRPVLSEEFDQRSPPVVFEDLVIVGSRVPDRVQRKFEPPGTVQAFDTRSGDRRWVFFTIPQSNDDFGADTWENESWRYTGHANVWGLMSLDAERGLLYVPTSTPGGDYWGGHRLGANLFAESLVCLDARTGERQWHFQAVHHGVWDYDFNSPPNLVTINVDGRTIDAVAEVSKQGFTYVFDRVTGEPVWPIEERPVNTETDVPGEVLYPTQPFPTKPPPFAKQGVSLDDANDLTPEIHALAVEEMQLFRLGPLFTPPSLRGTLMRPTVSGGADWGGAAFDPETGLLYVRSTEGTTTNQVCRNTGEDPAVEVDYSNNCPHGAAAIIFGNRPGASSCPVRAGGAQQARGHPADQAAVCASGGDRPERGRDCVEGSVRRGQPRSPQPSIAQGCRAARPAGYFQPSRLAGDEGRPGAAGRRRPVSVCIRQGDGRGNLARRDTVPDQREPDDLPRAVGAAVRRHWHRRRT